MANRQVKNVVKRSFKQAKRNFKNDVPLKSKKEQRKLNAEKAKKERFVDGVAKPRGVLGNLVDDEEEITEQKKEAQVDTVKWFDTIPTYDGENDAASPTVAQIEVLYKKATKLYEEVAYGSTSASFEEEMLTKGTASDKIAALSLLIAQEPIHKLHLLEQLLALCQSHSNRVSELATQTAQDLFLNNLLPQQRILVAFRDNKLMGLIKGYKKGFVEKETLDKVLIAKYFEDQLKKKYKEFIAVLEEKTLNPIETIRIRGVRAIRDLIKGSVEERMHLLKLLIDKFNDKHKIQDGATVESKSSKIPTRVMHYLSTLVSAGASGVNNPHFVRGLDRKYIIREASNFLYSPDINVNVKIYYATFLNKIQLVDGPDQELAQMLIKAYMNVSEVQFKNKDMNANLLSAVLAGIYRAFRIAKLPAAAYQEHVEMMFKISRKSEFNKSVEAIRVLAIVSKESGDIKLITRFYTLLYDKLLDQGIRDSHKRQTFLITVLRSLIDDSNIDRIKCL